MSGSSARRLLPAAVVALLAVLATSVTVAGAGTSATVVGGRSPESVDVSGSRVVYADRRDGSAGIFLYDGLDGSTLRITDASASALQPSIAGALVAYTGWSGGYADIYLYDAASGSTRVISSAVDNQVSPSVSERWVVWEDHRTTYSAQIWSYDLTTGVAARVDSGYNLPKRRPRVAGDVVVWQDYAGQPSGRFDSDVKAYDLGARTFITVANSTRSEIVPETDGRYVVWAEENSAGDLDIRAYDTVSRAYFDVCTDAGEQTYPVLDDGIVYWVDAADGTPHIDSRPVEGGTTSAFETYAPGPVTALAADNGIAWLQKDGGRWRVRASLGESGPMAVLARFVEPLVAWRQTLLARIAAPADDTAPDVLSTSVEAGELQVNDRSFTAYFSEPLAADSVDAETVSLVAEATGKTVPARVTYSSLAKSVTVVPEVALDGTYRLTWGTGLTDTAGNPLQEAEQVIFATGIELAELTAPTVPQKVVARPEGLTQIHIRWLASADSGSGVKQYRVYRSQYPGAAPVEVAIVSAPATSAIVPESGDASRKYTQYYSVRAEDNDGNLSAFSAMGSPDPHGATALGYSIESCTLCHQVHGAPETPEGTMVGALGAKTAAACYECHGGTPGEDSYGYASTLDSQGLLGEDDAIASDGPDLPGGATIHRNAAMSSGQRECDSCHSPHRKPYNEIAGVYDSATSYGKLLKGNTAKTGATYSTDAAAFGNDFCFGCHGAGVMTYMNDVGGAQAFDDAGGDHETGFGSSAHSPATVLPSAGTGGKPQANCLACHNEHASPNNGLTDYRQTNTKAITYNQAGLCFACHSATSTEGAKSVGTVPFTWNGRDVRAEFQRASRHPTSAPLGGVVADSGSWTQTTQADFQTDVLIDTVATAGGSIELAPDGGAGPTVFSDGFETNDFTAWDADPPYWQTTTADEYTGTYGARGYATSTTRRTDYLVKTIDVAGRTNIRLNYAYKVVGLAGGTDYFRVEYYSGGSWTQLYNTTANVTSWTTRSDTIPATATQIRFTSSVNSTSEFCYVDDVSVTADALPYTYVNSGSARTGAISVAGTIDGWTELRLNGAQPAGSALRVDVLDGADDEVLMSDLTLAMSPIPLVAIDENAHPTLKLRARLTGDSALPPTVTDDFNDNSFDVAKWTDAFLNGSIDPDAGGTFTVWSDGFESNDLSAWDAGGTWTPSAGAARTGSYGARVYYNYPNWGGSAGSDTGVVTKTLDLSGYTNPQISFYRATGSLDSPQDYLRVEYSTDGGGNWTTLLNTSANVAWTQTTYALPSAASVRIRFTGYVYNGSSNSTEYIYLDDIIVSGTVAPGSQWPKETDQQLQLRAEGAAFGGTADEGEFAYIAPSSGPWIAAGAFDLKVSVEALNNAAGGTMKAGLMLRTGTSEANALATGAKMAGLYVTPANAVFQYRTAVGGTTAGPAAVSGTPPEWLLLQRRGNTVTAKSSDDGASWTTIGSQTVTMDASVLVGVAITSAVNGSFSEATWDDFSVTGTTPPSSVTPTLDDWTVDYTHFPPQLAGKLTCVNCHNVHVAQKGAASSVWQTSRVNDPDNIKSASPGTVTEFCRKCHDAAPPTRTFSVAAIVPYSPVFTDMSAYPFFPGWNKFSAIGFASSAHGNSTIQSMTIGCENCHDPHGSDNPRLTAATAFYGGATPPANHVDLRRNNTSTSAEENLCYACHTNDRTPNCVSAGCHTSSFDRLNLQTAFAQTYRHPVERSGRHSDTEDASDLGSANRHAECADCHDVHSAGPARHVQGSSVAGTVLRGAIGVKPVYTTGNGTTASSYALQRLDMVGSDDYEAYVCFKCHTSYSGQPYQVTSGSGTYTSTDLAVEFNPANESGHNVIGTASVWPKTSGLGASGDLTWSLPTDSNWLRAGWTRTSKVTCSDCHTYSASGARGPHGSSVAFMIDSAYTTRWSSATFSNITGVICNKCHTNFSNMNNTHSENRHDSSMNCIECHIRIPHGWKRPRLIGYTSDPAPYASTETNGITLQNYTPTSWDESDCGANCGRHSSSPSGTRWP